MLLFSFFKLPVRAVLLLFSNQTAMHFFIIYFSVHQVNLFLGVHVSRSLFLNKFDCGAFRKRIGQRNYFFKACYAAAIVVLNTVHL
jgi:hypothetical protein